MLKNKYSKVHEIDGKKYKVADTMSGKYLLIQESEETKMLVSIVNMPMDLIEVKK